MNCSVCGSPLLFDRVVFRCSCGAYVHAYCVDKHIVDSHRPDLEEGYADLNGEFHPKVQPVAVSALTAEAASVTSEQQEGEEPVEEDLIPGESVLEEEIVEEGGGEDADEDS